MYCIVSHIQPDIVGITEDDPVGISQRCLVQNWLSHTEESMLNCNRFDTTPERNGRTDIIPISVIAKN